MRTRPVIKPALYLAVLVAFGAALVGLLVGCGASAGTERVHDMASLQSRLQAAGAKVEIGEVIKHPFLAVPGRIMTVNSVDIEVFQYADAKALAADTATIEPDGCIGTFGGGMLNPWTAPPHFYKSEGVMVIYLGSDSNMLHLLTSVLGKQFAGK